MSSFRLITKERPISWTSYQQSRRAVAARAREGWEVKAIVGSAPQGFPGLRGNKSKWAGRWTRTDDFSLASPQCTSDCQELFSSLASHRLSVEFPELVKRIADRFSGRCDHGFPITVGAADRLDHDPVDDAKTR